MNERVIFIIIYITLVFIFFFKLKIPLDRVLAYAWYTIIFHVSLSLSRITLFYFCEGEKLGRNISTREPFAPSIKRFMKNCRNVDLSSFKTYAISKVSMCQQKLFWIYLYYFFYFYSVFSMCVVIVLSNRKSGACYVFGCHTSFILLCLNGNLKNQNRINNGTRRCFVASVFEIACKMKWWKKLLQFVLLDTFSVAI